MKNNMKNKALKKAESFLKYIQEHPNERFWQALRNWSGYNYILGARELPERDRFNNYWEDTFYIED